MTVKQEVQASSIGNVFPPIKVERMHDPGNDRIKGIYLDSIEEPEHLSKVFSDLITLRDYLRILNSGEVSRITARFFVNKGVRIPEDLRGDVEAQISLDEEFGDYNLVYLGRNFNGRIARVEITERQRAKAQDVEERTPFSGRNSLDLLRKDDVVIRTIKPSPNESDFESLAKEVLELYQVSFFGDYAFPMTLDSVKSLLRRDTNVVKVIQSRKDSKICSIGVGETIALPVRLNGEQKTFNMAEISDAATPRDYEGRGYYSAIAAEITRELLKSGVNLIYGEARAASPPVMVVCKKTGRTIARDYHGRPAVLHKHCIISGAKDERLDDADENGKYKGLENLLVWYATRSQLMDLYVPK